ncbi:MAG TPA: hypothetical protein VGJ27_01345 [Gaiellaceae bacterium]
MTRPQRRRRRSGGRRRLVWALVLALVFFVGIAFGEALEDNPRPASTITRNQTFTLLPESSTVTVTAP